MRPCSLAPAAAQLGKQSFLLLTNDDRPALVLTALDTPLSTAGTVCARVAQLVYGRLQG